MPVGTAPPIRERGLLRMFNPGAVVSLLEKSAQSRVAQAEQGQTLHLALERLVVRGCLSRWKFTTLISAVGRSRVFQRKTPLSTTPRERDGPTSERKSSGVHCPLSGRGEL